jgi:Tol biopolymer transport system component
MFSKLCLSSPVACPHHRRAVRAWPAGLALIALAAAARAQETLIRVSVDSEGNQIAGHNSFPIDVSWDGRVTTFWGAGFQGSPWIAVYTHDRVTGATHIVSVDSAGNPNNDHCASSSLSADGRYVAFTGDATNLVPGDTNFAPDAFVHDLYTGETTRVSVGSGGTQANDYSNVPMLSSDGRYVAFESAADNLAPGDTNGWSDVFLHDRVTQETRLVSVTSAGIPSTGYSDAPSISARGRHVAFASSGADFVAGDTNGSYDVFVHDFVTGQTVCASLTPAGVPGNAPSRAPALSRGGRYVAFPSYASDLVSDDTNGVCDVFVRDLALNSTTRVSVDSSGAQLTLESWPLVVSISADGQVVGFTTAALSTAPTPLYQSVVHDRRTGETRIVSTTPEFVEGNQRSWATTLSADGRFVVFASEATDLVPRDTNGGFDIFSFDRFGDSPSIVNYCSAQPPTSHGCEPSLSGTGVPRCASSGFTVSLDGAEGATQGVCFYGTSGSQHLPFASGTMCVAGSIQRTGFFTTGGTAGACDGHFEFDWNTYLWTHPSALGQPLRRGETVWIQAWMRDPLNAGASNLSDALWFTVCP